MVTKTYEFLRNFRRSIPEKFSGISEGKILEKFSGISRTFFYYWIPLKIRKHGDQVPRISQEFLEKYSGEILRNFLGWNSGEIPRNFSNPILLLNSPKNPQTWWPIPKKFSGISGEIFRRNSEEFLGGKFRGISQEFLETESQNCDPQ